MRLSAANVAHVASLARLALTPEELEEMTMQLGQILTYVEQLNELDTSGVEPMAHPLSLSNVLRADEVGESLPVERAMANAPARTDECFRVPPVFQ